MSSPFTVPTVHQPPTNDTHAAMLIPTRFSPFGGRDEFEEYSGRPSAGHTTTAVTTTSPHVDAVCTICCEVPPRENQCTVPACGHIFCVDCLVTWSTVRPVCPNCKIPYDMLRVRRNVISGGPLQNTTSQQPQVYEFHPKNDDGSCDSSPENITETTTTTVEQEQDTVNVHVDVLRASSWVNVQPLEPVQADIAEAFQLFHVGPEELRREAERAALLTGVPTYACEEAEDAAEEMFWEQEYRRYEHDYPDDDFVGRSSSSRPRRVLGNRRHGPNGYLARGHMLATPTQAAACPSNMAQSPASVMASSPSSSASSTLASGHKPPVKTLQCPDDDCMPPTRERERKPSSSGGKRKKKVKKKSRAAAQAVSGCSSGVELLSGSTSAVHADRADQEPSAEAKNSIQLA